MNPNPLATGIYDMSNGEAHFSKPLHEMGMHTGIYDMSGGHAIFGRKNGRQFTGIRNQHGGQAYFTGQPWDGMGIENSYGGYNHFNFNDSPTPSPPMPYPPMPYPPTPSPPSTYLMNPTATSHATAHSTA